MKYLKLFTENNINDFNSDGKLYKILDEDPEGTTKTIDVTDKDVSIVSRILNKYTIEKEKSIKFDDKNKIYHIYRIVASSNQPISSIFIYRLPDYYYIVNWFGIESTLQCALCDSESGLEQLLRDISSQKINESNEKLGYRYYLDECWYNADIGDVVPQDYIYNYVEYLHRNEEDFIDGDIGDRIGEFSKYKLMEISIDRINIDEYELDIDDMKEYKKIFKETNDYPPIILDGNTEWSFRNNYTIIDGNHRVNALHRLGEKTIKAWVGQN